jgi:hypothetical protein
MIVKVIIMIGLIQIVLTSKYSGRHMVNGIIRFMG